MDKKHQTVTLGQAWAIARVCQGFQRQSANCNNLGCSCKLLPFLYNQQMKLSRTCLPFTLQWGATQLCSTRKVTSPNSIAAYSGKSMTGSRPEVKKQDTDRGVLVPFSDMQETSLRASMHLSSSSGLQSHQPLPSHSSVAKDLMTMPKMNGTQPLSRQ